MSNLTITNTEFTPEVNFSFENKTLLLEGKSMPEDARLFYKPLLHWISEQEGKNIDKLEFTVNLSYLNSSSSKQLLKLFYALEDLEETGTKSKVIWQYEKSDAMTKEKGEEFDEMVELPFSFLEV